MMKIYPNTYFILLAFLLNYCASTKLTSFKDPDYNNTHFKSILVIVNSNDLEKKMALETSMVEALKKTGVNALEGFNLFPPTRNYTVDEKIVLLKEKEIDSYLSVIVGESGVSNVYVPPTSSKTETKGNISVIGNDANYEEKTKTTYQGGYTLSKPWAEFQTELYDVSNGRKAWLSSSSTAGNALASFNTVINSFAKEVTNQLESDGLILTRDIINERNVELKKAKLEKREARVKEIIRKNREATVTPDAVIIYLKNGNKVKGTKLAEEKRDNVLIKYHIRLENGKYATYNGDEIDRIEIIK